MTQRIMQLEVHYMIAGQLAVNVLHFQGDVAGTDLFQLAKNGVDAFNEVFPNAGFRGPSLQPVLSADCFISAAVARIVGATSGPKYPRIFAAADYPGDIAGEVYSQQVATNIKFVTASGPDYTGRAFIPGVPESWIETNRFTTTAETAYAGLIDELSAGLITSDGTYDQAVYRQLTQTAELVTNRMLVPNPGTIRRRLSPY